MPNEIQVTGLSFHKNVDGLWVTFKSERNMECSINLTLKAQSGSIRDVAFHDWALDQYERLNKVPA